MFDHAFAGGPEGLDSTLAPRPRMLRVLVIDDGLPPPFVLWTLPFEIGEYPFTAAYPFDPNWLERLKESIKGKG